MSYLNLFTKESVLSSFVMIIGLIVVNKFFIPQKKKTLFVCEIERNH